MGATPPPARPLRGPTGLRPSRPASPRASPSAYGLTLKWAPRGGCPGPPTGQGATAPSVRRFAPPCSTPPEGASPLPTASRRFPSPTAGYQEENAISEPEEASPCSPKECTRRASGVMANIERVERRGAGVTGHVRQSNFVAAERMFACKHANMMKIRSILRLWPALPLRGVPSRHLRRM